MPKYRNDGSTIQTYKDVFGRGQHAVPGQEVTTFHNLAAPWTITDPTPFYNPVLSITDVTFSAAEEQEVTVDTDCERLLIYGVTGCIVEPFVDSSANTPALHSPLAAGDELEVYTKDQMRKIVLVSDAAGSCTIKQLWD